MAIVYVSGLNLTEFGSSTIAHKPVDFVCATSTAATSSFETAGYDLSVVSSVATSSFEEIDWYETSSATVVGIVTEFVRSYFDFTSTLDAVSFPTGMSVDVFATSSVASSSTPVYGSGPEIVSTATVLGLDFPVLQVVTSATSSAATSSSAEPGFLALSTSSVAGSSTYDHFVMEYQTDTSSSATSSAVVYTVGKYDSYTSTAAVTDSTTNWVSFVQVVAELLGVSSKESIAGLKTIALVMNPSNTAMSTYDNVQYNSLFQTRTGDVFLVCDDGIYKMTGNTDAGTAITSTAVIGLTDFKNPNKKRLDTVYLTYSGAGMTLNVGATDHTDGHSVTGYDVDIRAATTPVNSRFTVGKGLVGRYWRFTISNKTGGDFGIFDMSATMAVSSRRL